MTTDGFEVDPESLDRFRSGTLGDLRNRIEQMRSRLAGTSVPGHTYTTTEAGLTGYDSHRSVLEGFDQRLGLAGQQVETLYQRLLQTASEYREQDRSGSDRVNRAGADVEGVV